MHPINRPTQLILYELNEVPWRLVDWYVAKRPRSHLNALIHSSSCYTTVTHDCGELSPWVTWPTIHRGVNNRLHGIKFLNQDLWCASGYPPIWEKLALAGMKVGVFGSLQSFPIPTNAKYSFYVPDTFAPRPDTLPAELSLFQSINLSQTERDSGKPSDVRIDRRLARNVLRLFAIGLRIRTCAELTRQVAWERWRPVYRTRRSVLQAPLAFDIFSHILRRTEPDFATFFTNHVAGMMHRFWKFAFPEDFDYDLIGTRDRFFANNVLFAMDVADRQIGWLMRHLRRSGGRLVVASSMGQEAIARHESVGEIRIHDARKFMTAIGFDRPFESLLAMHPEFNFRLRCETDATQLAELLGRVQDSDGKCIFSRLRTEGSTLNTALRSSRALANDGVLELRVDNDVCSLTLAGSGLALIERETGTGYHQPNGILIWNEPRAAIRTDRQMIDSIELHGMLLRAFGLEDRAEHVPGIYLDSMQQLQSDLSKSSNNFT